ANFRQGCELVLNGYIGKVKRVEVGLPSGHSVFDKLGPDLPITEPPPGVDYDFWVGPAEFLPFTRSRFHKYWRWNYAYGGGQLLGLSGPRQQPDRRVRDLRPELEERNQGAREG